MPVSMAEEWKGGDTYGEQGSYERKGCFGSIEGAQQPQLEQGGQDGGGIGSHAASQQKVGRHLTGRRVSARRSPMQWAQGGHHDLCNQLRPEASGSELHGTA